MKEKLARLNQKVVKVQNKLFCLYIRHFFKTIKYRPVFSLFITIIITVGIYFQPDFKEQNGFCEIERLLITVMLSIPLIMLHLLVITKPEYVPDGVRLKKIHDYYLRKIKLLKDSNK